MILRGGSSRRRATAGRSGALILADPDHFKNINDTYGHAAGDAMLRAFADACTRAARSTDLVGRYGGEEFIILIPGAGGHEAEASTTSISRRIAAAQIPMPTSSYGSITYRSGEIDIQDLIEAADAALYRAKAQGREPRLPHPG